MRVRHSASCPRRSAHSEHGVGREQILALALHICHILIDQVRVHAATLRIDDYPPQDTARHRAARDEAPRDVLLKGCRKKRRLSEFSLGGEKALAFPATLGYQLAAATYRCLNNDL